MAADTGVSLETSSLSIVAAPLSRPMNDPNTHREIVAAVASLKSCLRSVVLAVSASTGKIPGSLTRASDALANLNRLLSAVSDQTLRLPLETSKRLIEVDLPDLLQQLLSACQPHSTWPEPDSTEPMAAITHPDWAEVQQLIADVFQVLTLLCGVAVRACSRSSDPLMVLLQLASPKVMEACVAYMQQLWQAHAEASAAATEPAPAVPASDQQQQPSSPSSASHSFAAVVAAFSSCYSLLVAAVDVQPGLEELELQLVSSLCSTGFLPVAVKLLLAASCPDCQHHSLEVQCQQAGWHLLTLALFLSGGDIAISPAGPSSVEVRPGQHIPSSVLAAHMRLEGKGSGAAATTASAAASAALAATASMAATEAVTGLPLASMQQQLLGPEVLLFLEERLYHAVREMRGSSSSNLLRSSSLEAGMQAALCAGPLLLPGRCVPDDQDVLTAALRTLRCWRALLVGPAGPTLPLASSCGVQLLLAVLNGALAESIKDGSSERQALRGRLVRVAVHCLQLLCGCVAQRVLAEQLYSLTAALSGVVSAAGAYWDAHKRVIKSADLSYTGQVRCVDKTTGDMLVRYTMAAQSALLVLMQLVDACSTEQPAGAALSEKPAVAMMLSAGLLPAIEQLFRQVPVVSPAHVAAADVLVHVLPLSKAADMSAGQLPLMATLRKFLIKGAGVAEPDRDAAIATAVKLADMLGRLASSCDSLSTAIDGSQSGIVLQHAAMHLLPALQVFCSHVLKGSLPGPCSLAPSGAIITVPALAAASAAASTTPGPCCHLFSVVLSTYSQLAALARRQPQLGLLELLLGNQALHTAAGIVGSNYWNSPQVAAVAALPCNASLTGHHAAQLVTSLLESLLVGPSAPAAAVVTPLLHASCSDGCLFAIKRSSANNMCPVGNLQCGLDGQPCSCCSPKACSDVAAHMQGLAGDAMPPAACQPRQHKQQHLLLLSAVLQSKLLPEAHRLLQQLPQATGGGGQLEAAAVHSETPRQAGGGAFASAAMAVPSRLGSGQLHSKDSSIKIGGHSPTYASLNGHASNLRSPSSAPQQFFSAYTGSEPPSYGSGNSGNLLRMPGGLRVAAGARRTSDGTPAAAAAAAAIAAGSPNEGDCGGLLRGGSWGSFQTAWVGSSSGPGGELRLGRQSSSGFGSSASLASSEALGALHDSMSSAAGRGVSYLNGVGAVGSLSESSLLLPLQLRLQAVLLAVGYALLELADAGLLGDTTAGRLSIASGTLSNTSSCDGTVAAAAAAAAARLPQLQLRSRPSYSGSASSMHSLLYQENIDVFAGLRACLAAAKQAGSVVLSASGTGQTHAKPASRAGVQQLLPAGDSGSHQDQAANFVEGNSNEMLFPVELGISQLHISAGQPTSAFATVAAGAAGQNAVAAAVGDSIKVAEPAVLRDVLRGLVGSVQAAGPVLARSCSALECEQSGHVLMARLSPKPIGCWNPACANMAGTSEAATPSKPCANCKVAVFCSKGCEKTAWPSHTLACGKLTATTQQ